MQSTLMLCLEKAISATNFATTWRACFDTMPIVDTVGELVEAELSDLLRSKGGKVRNPCVLHFFSSNEVIEAKKIESSSNEGML